MGMPDNNGTSKWSGADKLAVLIGHYIDYRDRYAGRDYASLSAVDQFQIDQDYDTFIRSPASAEDSPAAEAPVEESPAEADTTVEGDEIPSVDTSAEGRAEAHE